MSERSSEFEKEVQLMDKMAALGLDEADIEETFDSDSAGVMLFHRPSGLLVKYQATPDREKNRLLARQLLIDKIEGWQKITIKASRTKIRYASLVIAFIFVLAILIFVYIVEYTSILRVR